VGAASTLINPAPETFLGGYDKDRKCTGVHDDLHAKAVVFDDNKTPVALVILDSLGLQYDTVQEARKAASDRVKAIALPPERIVICSTHTHCSPDVIGIYGPDEATTGRNPAYLKKVVDQIAVAVAKAVDRLQPATLTWVKTEGGPWAVNDSEPGVTEKAVTILQCVDAKGKPIATLTHFACHPTVLDGDTTLASADWVGAFYADMDKAVPGENLFLQGGVGGWIQPETPERTFSLAEKYGKDLAERVLAALPKAQPIDGSAIRFANKPFDMPNDSEAFKQMAEAHLVPRPMADTIQTEVAWFSVGNAQFATHPGETAPAFTWATQKLMDTEPKFVLGLGLDELGYIIRPEFFDKPDQFPAGPYLTSMSAGRNAGPSMMTALESIIP
jgi:hypothetical protein